jgi:hypothetical protein
VFDLRRFVRLARSQWAEQWRAYAWFFALGAVLHLTLVIITALSDQGMVGYTLDYQTALFTLGLFALGTIFAGRYFADMARKESALLLLMRPASVFEKWVLAVLIVAVGFPLAFAAAFYVVDLPAWWFAKAAAVEMLRAENPGAAETARQMERYALFLPISRETRIGGLLEMLAWLWMCQAFAMFGSLWFRRMPFLKTLFAAFLLWLLGLLLAGWRDAQPALFLDIWTTTRSLSPLQSKLFPVLWILVPVLMVLATYRALKEREVSP